MISNEVKERLLKKNWFVTSQNKQETSLVLQVCDDAGITWAAGEKATIGDLSGPCPLYITFYKHNRGITYDDCAYYDSYEKHGLENITDWFFNSIKNNDSKLIPQNEEQEHLVQMLLAKLRGIPVECWSIFGQKWVDSTSNTISTDAEYRLKQEPTLTPLPISRELWSYIDKQWKYAAMDKNKKIFFYEKRPAISKFDWRSISCVARSPFNINTDGINWETSLTERPKDV